MNGLSEDTFYGPPKPHKFQNLSLSLVANTLHSSIFQALRFPVREKATKNIRGKISTNDRHLYIGKSVEDILSSVLLIVPTGT